MYGHHLKSSNHRYSTSNLFIYVYLVQMDGIVYYTVLFLIVGRYIRI